MAHATDAYSNLPFVLVHGAWHGSWTYERIIPLLAAQGHMAVARDLPAHGINARFPRSYFTRPLDKEAFANEPSPVAATSLEEYATNVLETIDQVCKLGHDKVVLVGHSMGGIAITAAAERAPEKIAALVYLAAFMPDSGVPAIAYIQSPQNQGELVGPQLLADPQRIGVLRIDQRSADPNYRATAKQAFYGDVSQEQYDAVANLLTCDVPVAPFATPIVTTASGWGTLPRHYIQCLQDRVILPALQQRFIDEADAFMPGNPTKVHQMNTSHSPFVSSPHELASILGHIVRGLGRENHRAHE